MVSYVDEQEVNFDMFNKNYNETGENLDQVLRITVHKCEGLKNVDMFGKSDPYVCIQNFNSKVIIGPNKSTKKGSDTVIKGRVVENDLNPEFEENYYFPISSGVNRCKIIVKDDGITDTTLGTQILNFPGVSGEGTIKLVPKGTLTYSYQRAPLGKALQMEGTSVSWDSDSYPCVLKRLVAITVLSGENLHDGQQEYYLKLKGFTDTAGNELAIRGGTYNEAQQSKTLISRSSTGTAKWDSSFLFAVPELAEGLNVKCNLVLYDDDFLKDDKLSTGTLIMDRASGVVDVAMEPRGTIRVQYAQIDMDVGSTYDAEEERAAIEAEQARIAEEERERREAEEAAAAAEAEAAAIRLAAEQARQEAEKKAAEEKARLEEELRLAKEAAKAAEEQARIEEQMRQAAIAAEEERKRLEAAAKAAAEAEAAAREAERIAREKEVRRQNILSRCSTNAAGGQAVGAGLANGGVDPWTNVNDILVNAHTKYGWLLGVELRYIQNVGGKVYYYGGGTSSGNANGTCVRVDPSTFSTCHTPGETVGQGLPGTGQMSAPGGENKIDQAIAWGMKNHGLVPGQNLRYIQFAGGKTYFYAAGSSSGNAGSDCFRMDPR